VLASIRVFSNAVHGFKGESVAGICHMERYVSCPTNLDAFGSSGEPKVEDKCGTPR
jgi:hypothetical protein